MRDWRRVCAGVLAAAGVWLAALPAHAVLTLNNSFRSPRNKEREARRSTTLIILHTTEAPSRSALRKVSDLGECHFCIDEAGRAYRIIDHRRVAFHSGRSMWNGKANVDDFSIGIEVCGYHNKPLSAAQIQTLSELIGEMKAVYKIPDQNVLAHSHVAYGAPNKWQARSHRGRKRCGMQFGTTALRTRLNLKAKPPFDPDVRAGRLVAADAELARTLYGSAPAAPARAAAPARTAPAAPAADANVIAVGRGAWDIARDAYDDPTTLYLFPDGTRKRGDQILNFKLLPPGTRVTVNAAADNRTETYQTVGVNGRAQDITGKESLLVSTIYVYPDGRVVRGSQIKAEDVLKLPYGTRILLGYSMGGPVTAGKPASSFCGGRWRAADTFFLISNVLVPGNKVDDAKIPAGTLLFYKN